MKQLLVSLSFFLFTGIFATLNSQTLNAHETGLLTELNLMRTNPSAYAKYFEEVRDGSMHTAYGNVADRCNALITKLKATSPLPALEINSCLYKAAEAQQKWIVNDKNGDYQNNTYKGKYNSDPGSRMGSACFASGIKNQTGISWAPELVWTGFVTIPSSLFNPKNYSSYRMMLLHQMIGGYNNSIVNYLLNPVMEKFGVSIGTKGNNLIGYTTYGIPTSMDPGNIIEAGKKYTIRWAEGAKTKSYVIDPSNQTLKHDWMDWEKSISHERFTFEILGKGGQNNEWLKVRIKSIVNGGEVCLQPVGTKIQGTPCSSNAVTNQWFIFKHSSWGSLVIKSANSDTYLGAEGELQGPYNIPQDFSLGSPLQHVKIEQLD